MSWKILKKEFIAPQIARFIIDAPRIAQKHKTGQFVIVRINESGERIPLSVPDSDPEKGTLMLVVQEVGKTSALMNRLEAGDELLDVVGPLGQPTHIENFGIALGVGGGVGIAPLHPIAKALKSAGNHVISILGGRSKEFVIMEDMMRSASDEVLICTDDGSYGEQGFVTNVLQNLLDSDRKIDYCIAIGPPIMMKRVCEVTKPFNVKTYVSLNTLMVDGTGMCGACRVNVGGETKFVCVDGPEFDGHQVDYDLMFKRMAMYHNSEKKSYEDYLAHHKKCYD